MKQIRLVAITGSLLLPATLQQPGFFQELPFTDRSAFHFCFAGTGTDNGKSI